MPLFSRKKKRPAGLILAEVVPSGLNRKYLRPSDLRRLRTLFFSGRRAIEGAYSGRHDTRQRGHSVEFRDYREYLPGDDVGAVDWKVFGRSDRLVVKIFEHQADMTVNLVVDGSASMAYRGGATGVSKFDQACHLAAAIGFLICKQHDRVSFSVAQKGLMAFHRAAGSMLHLAGILDTMERTTPRGEAQLAGALGELAQRTRRRDIVIVFSDLWDDQEVIKKALSTIVGRGGEAILFHVLHPDEMTLPRVEQGLFVDSENRSSVRLTVPDVRAVYEEKLAEHLRRWQRIAAGMAVDYHRVLTSEPYERGLERYLFRRAASR